MHIVRRFICVGLGAACAMGSVLAGCATTEQSAADDGAEPAAATGTASAVSTRKDLDKTIGKSVAFSLSHNIGKNGERSDSVTKSTDWKVADYVGTGEVKVDGESVVIGTGNDMSGIVYTGPLVRENYEITLEASKVAGDDFFCGLTFPIGPDPCTLVVGGWGGTLVGVSSLDYYDASMNGTAKYRTFEHGKWYAIRLRVTAHHIEAWIDGEKLVDVDTEGKKVDIRFECDPCKPLGIATWQTTGAIRNMNLRVLTDGEIAGG